MSTVEALVAKLCPEGVEFKALGEIATYTRGISYKKNDEQVDGSISVLRSNNITLERNQLNFDNVKKLNSSVHVRSDQWLQNSDILISAASGSKAHVGKVAYIDKQNGYSFGAFMAVVRVEKNQQSSMISKFLFHLLSSRSFEDHLKRSLKSTTINNLNAGIMKKFRIPVPPLDVQCAIVEILDRYSELVYKLEIELNAQIIARRKQYEYCRNELLNFSSESSKIRDSLGIVLNEKVEFKALGEIAIRNKGTKITATKMKELHTEGGAVRIFAGGKTTADVDESVLPERDITRSPGIIVKSRGYVGFEYYDRPFSHKNEFWSYSVNSETINLKFIYYFLDTLTESLQRIAKATSVKIPQLCIGDTDQIRIPVPPLEVQNAIVEILDRYSVLVSKLEIELKDEIISRRQQYEYCRNLLLSFPERERMES
ncbi:MAG: restriction endonuclease subunit S [Bacteroidetes bacterium]|nr:restriction endonuclease subunit S [Bacteroidota bacterium]